MTRVLQSLFITTACLDTRGPCNNYLGHVKNVYDDDDDDDDDCVAEWSEKMPKHVVLIRLHALQNRTEYYVSASGPTAHADFAAV